MGLPERRCFVLLHLIQVAFVFKQFNQLKLVRRVFNFAFSHSCSSLSWFYFVLIGSLIMFRFQIQINLFGKNIDYVFFIVHFFRHGFPYQTSAKIVGEIQIAACIMLF